MVRIYTIWILVDGHRRRYFYRPARNGRDAVWFCEQNREHGECVIETGGFAHFDEASAGVFEARMNDFAGVTLDTEASRRLVFCAEADSQRGFPSGWRRDSPWKSQRGFPCRRRLGFGVI